MAIFLQEGVNLWLLPTGTWRLDHWPYVKKKKSRFDWFLSRQFQFSHVAEFWWIILNTALISPSETQAEPGQSHPAFWVERSHSRYLKRLFALQLFNFDVNTTEYREYLMQLMICYCCIITWPNEQPCDYICIITLDKKHLACERKSFMLKVGCF